MRISDCSSDVCSSDLFRRARAQRNKHVYLCQFQPYPIVKFYVWEVRMLERDGSKLFTEDHRAFRDAVRRFIEREFSPRVEEFEESGRVERDFWLKCGEAGLLCPPMPEAYGGPGLGVRERGVAGTRLVGR